MRPDVKDDLYIANVLAGFREDLQGVESIIEIGPLLQTALERLERRIPREEAKRIVMEVFYDTQRT